MIQYADNPPCFTELSFAPHYIRIVYQSPIGCVARVRYCLKQFSIICRDANRTSLLLIRIPDGMHPYSIDELIVIAEYYQQFFAGMIIAYVDPSVTKEGIFISAVNRHHRLSMVAFHHEADAVLWLDALKEGC
jgi:hypothetical protein